MIYPTGTIWYIHELRCTLAGEWATPRFEGFDWDRTALSLMAALARSKR